MRGIVLIDDLLLLFIKFNIMKKQDIQKILYKEQLTANLTVIRGSIVYYSTVTSVGKIFFDIPVSDMGITDFKSTMEAKHLVRWLKLDDNNDVIFG